MKKHLLIIILVSFLIRVINIHLVPPELFGDEIDVGYQAFSLLKTGKDIYGQKFPLYIHSLSEWRLPGLIYMTVPTIAVFGNNELGVRMPEVIFGSVGCLLIYLLAYQTTRNKKIALIAGLLLSVTPWHVMYSRAAFEAVILLDLIILGCLTFIDRKFILSAILFGLCVYTYSTAIVFTPLLIVSLVLFAKIRPSIKSIVLYVLMLIPFLYFTTTGQATGRFSYISIFGNENITKSVTESRNKYPSELSRIWFNRPIEIVRAASANYFSAFSPEFLFIRGDPTFRHSLQFVGELLPLTAPFLILGIYQLINRKKYIYLAWLILAPIPSMLTIDGGYHATRLFTMLPPLILATAIGFEEVIKFLSDNFVKKTLLFSLGLIFIIQLLFVGHNYFTIYPIESWRWWHEGYKQIFTVVNQHGGEYSRIFINNTYEPSLIRFLFYTSYPPEKFQANFKTDKPIAEIVPGYNGFSLEDKYFFGEFDQLAKKTDINNFFLPANLYIISQRDDLPGDWDWRKTPPGNVSVIGVSTNPLDIPILYAVTKK